MLSSRWERRGGHNDGTALFTDEFKRESVALLESSGRPLEHVAKELGIQPSMSRKGNGWDNAPMESFFGSLKSELVHHRRYVTREDAKRDLFACIEGYYNRQRLHSAIGYRTPEQAELQVA